MATYFDATYYLAQNPDVQAAFGNDAAAAEAHYFANGAAEGRKPAPWFDADYYRANNADLANMSAADAFLHFTVNGINEGRSPQEGVELNAETFQAYAEANPDLVDAFGIEDTAALTDAQVTQLANHFFAFGSAEGREGGPVGEDGGDTSTLTEALGKLADAQTAETDYQKNLEIDAKIGVTEFKTSTDNTAAQNDTVATNYFNAAADALAGLDSTSVGAADYKLLNKSALQDADIATARTIAEGEVTVATAQAKTGMTALIEAADEALQQLKDANTEAGKASTNLSAELKAFEEANTGYTYNASTNVINSADYAAYVADAAITASDIIIHQGKAYVANVAAKGSATTYDHDTAAGTEITSTGTAPAVRISNLETAQAALNAANATVKTNTEALENAVGDIYVLETGGHSVKDIGSKAVTATAGAEAYILTATDVEVFKTEADANKDVVQQSITFGAVTAASGGTPTVSTLTVGDVTVTIPVATTAATAVGAAVLAAINSESENWTAEAGATADIVVLTAKTSAVNALEAGDVVFTPGTGDDNNASQAANTVDTATEVNIGETFEDGAGDNPAATNANNLKVKLDALEALEKAIADFEAARDIQVDLKDLEDAVIAAEKVLTDEDGEFAINLRDGAEHFTTSDDVYLFNADFNDGADLSLNNFGARGEDKIFFGEGFTLVGLDGKDITKESVGDAATLEIFWEQAGSAVNLYVEKEAFGGNASGPEDLVKITLTGVTGSEIADDLGAGFLSLGTAA